jgi:hypothetical protein
VLLSPAIDRVGRVFDRQERLDRQKIAEGRTFLVGELAAETVRVENRLPLRDRHLPQVTEGARHQPAAINRQAAQLLHGIANLLPLRHGQMFHQLVVFEYPPALLVGHVIQLGETVQHALLGLRRKLAEAGLILQSLLLLRERQIAVAIHPLGEVLLILPGTDCRSRSRLPLGNRSGRSRPGLAREAWERTKQEENRERG